MHPLLTPEAYAREVLPVFNTAKEVLGQRFIEAEYLAYIRLYRKRDLYFRRVVTPLEWYGVEWMGLCCAGADKDLMLLRADMDEILDCSTLGHEGGHLLSGHVGISPLTVEQLLQNPDELIKHVHFSRYNRPNNREMSMEEIVAEEIGLLFTECLIKNLSSMSRFTRYLHDQSDV